MIQADTTRTGVASTGAGRPAMPAHQRRAGRLACFRPRRRRSSTWPTATAIQVHSLLFHLQAIRTRLCMSCALRTCTTPLARPLAASDVLVRPMFLRAAPWCFSRLPPALPPLPKSTHQSDVEKHHAPPADPRLASVNGSELDGPLRETPGPASAGAHLAAHEQLCFMPAHHPAAAAFLCC